MRFTIGDTSNFEQFKYLIDNKYYIFRAILFNADSAITLTKTAIKELVLNDNIFNFYLDGHIVIDNTEDVIERYAPDPIQKEFSSNFQQNFGFKVRGDGRDILYITIIPFMDGEEPYDIGSKKINQLFGINYYFVLANETNLSSDKGKLKKYDIIDLDLQILKDKKIFFSTADLSKSTDITQVSDSQREAYTGDCIEAILKTTLQEDDIIKKDDNGDSVDFDTGIYKLFFSTPTSMSAWDTLQYILDLHVCSDTSLDFPIFKKDGFTGEFRLKSTAEAFRNAYIKQGDLDAGGAMFLENFNITGSQNSDQITVNDIKKPMLTLELGDMSDVVEVNFFNVPAELYTERVKTRIAHAYNFNNKQFVINSVDGNIENVKGDFTVNYVNPLKGKNQKPYPSFINNILKRTNQTYEDVFSIYHDPINLLNAGKNKTLFNSLILNMGVEIMVKGNLGRSGGMFFSIDRRGSYIDNDFDNKFLGIYYIIDVNHIFKDNTFYDKITAIKTYHFTDPKINENIL